MEVNKHTADSQAEGSRCSKRLLDIARSERDCATCFEQKPSIEFPDSLCTKNCDHDINTCRECTQEHIAVQLDAVRYDRLACAECPGILDGESIRTHGGEEAYQKFCELRHSAEEPERMDETLDEPALTEQRIAENAASMREVSRVSRPCSGCGAPIEKVGGCKLVNCNSYAESLVVVKHLAECIAGHCKRISCWRCGKRYPTMFPGNGWCCECPAK